MVGLKRWFLLVLLVCLGCSAQTSAPELSRRIERQVRASFSVPPTVNVSVGAPKPSSEFPSFNTVEITFSAGDRKQTHEFLVSKDGKTLMRLTKMDLSKDPYADIMQKIDTTGRPSRGAQNAKVVIVNYDDFQCPFCARMHQTLFPGLLQAYGDRVKIIYKDFPLYEIHPWANRAAVDSGCLAAQNNDAYWDFADYVHANGQEISGEKRPVAQQLEAVDQIARDKGKKHNLDAAKLEACIKTQSDAAVRTSVAEGMSLGVNATPTLFINGEKLDGAVPERDLRVVLDRALRDAGEPVPTSQAEQKPAPVGK